MSRVLELDHTHLAFQVVEIHVGLPEVYIGESIRVLARHVPSHVHQPVEDHVFPKCEKFVVLCASTCQNQK